MGGFVEAMLGAGIGAAGAAVNNAKHDQQQLDADAAEGRIMNREAALMYLRDKYAKGQAEHADGLARGRATFENDLKLDSLNDERVTAAEKRKREGAIEDHRAVAGIDDEYKAKGEERADGYWTKHNDIEFGQKRDLLDRNNEHETGLVNMKLKAAKGAGGLGDPDFVDARDSLTGYLGIENKDLNNTMLLNKKMGLPPDNKKGGEILKAATFILGANPNITPDEAVKFGSEIMDGKIKLGTAPVGNGKQLQYFTAGGRRYGYGRPN